MPIEFKWKKQLQKAKDLIHPVELRNWQQAYGQTLLLQLLQMKELKKMMVTTFDGRSRML